VSDVQLFSFIDVIHWIVRLQRSKPMTHVVRNRRQNLSN